MLTHIEAIDWLHSNGLIGAMVLERQPSEPGDTDNEVRFRAHVFAVSGLSKPALLGALQRSCASYEDMLVRGDYGGPLPKGDDSTQCPWGRPYLDHRGPCSPGCDFPERNLTE